MDCGAFQAKLISTPFKFATSTLMVVTTWLGIRAFAFVDVDDEDEDKRGI